VYYAVFRPEPQLFVYDGKKVIRLRQSATSISVEVLIINIHAFSQGFLRQRRQAQVEPDLLQGEREADRAAAD
jgi:hypothetical protein